MAMDALQAPLAQRWKAAPPEMQFQAPSSVQGVPAAKVPAEPLPEPLPEPVPDPVPEPVPVPAVVAALVVAEPEFEEPPEEDLVAVVRVVGRAVAELPIVTKTPPGREVELEGEGELAVVAVVL
jgi:hypothetical protein